MAKAPGRATRSGTKSRSRKKTAAETDTPAEDSSATGPERQTAKPKRRSRKKADAAPTETAGKAAGKSAPKSTPRKRKTAAKTDEPAAKTPRQRKSAAPASEPADKPKPARKRKTAAKPSEAAAKPASRRKPTATKTAEPGKPAAPKPARRRSVKGKAPTATQDTPQASVVVPRVSGTVTVRQKSNLYTQRIDQIGAAYSMIEDRVLVNISRKDRSGVKMWLTRRATNHLWHAMMKVLERRPDVAAQKNPVSKKAVMEFHQTSAVQTNDPKKPFRKDDLMYPHGEEPLLVHSFTCGPDPDGLLQVTLRFGKEREFTTSLDLRMVYLFCDLLVNSAKKMDWGITFGAEAVPKKEAEPTTTPASGKPVVH